MTPRKRVAVLFAMPLAIFLWIIGLTLIRLDSQPKKIQTKTFSQKEQSFVMVLPEQQILA
jgi:hypothetical protein